MRFLISILIPNYNKASYLRECLDSVLFQSYSDWECIIVDDRSTDKSFEIIQEYSKRDSRFKVFIRPDHFLKGGNVCRNYSLEKSSGEYIIFLDSDDVLAPYCLSQRMDQILKNKNQDFWAFPTALFENDVSDAKFLWNRDNSKESDLSRFLRMDALWQTSGPIYAREFLFSFKGLSPERKYWQDFELHLKALIKSKSYKKHFNLLPDVFIRNGDRSSLSRSTPFTGDLAILIERIEFLEEIENFAKECGKVLSTEELHSIFSFKYFLILQLWLKHGEFSKFKTRWMKYSQCFGMSRINQFKGLIHAFKLKMLNRINLRVFESNKKESLNFPNERILDQVQIGRFTIQS